MCTSLKEYIINNPNSLKHFMYTDDIGDQLCDRVLSVLFEIWLHACAKSFPSPRMWKTLTELAQSWRHRTSLITQWNRINLALTSRLLSVLYGSSFFKHSIGNNSFSSYQLKTNLCDV